MLPVALLAASLAPAAAAPCGPAAPTFVGQPGCVTLTFDGRQTHVHNACGAPVLVDASVWTGPPAAPWVAPGETATVRDLSAFSMGLEGELYRATAVWSAPECPAEPAPPAEPERPWLRAALAWFHAW